VWCVMSAPRRANGNEAVATARTAFNQLVDRIEVRALDCVVQRRAPSGVARVQDALVVAGAS